METVQLLEVNGQLRNIIWALKCCHGYNPCDHVFWGIASGESMCDKAWKVVCDMIGQPAYDVPTTLIAYSRLQDTKS